jgi:hypothetical protein
MGQEGVSVALYTLGENVIAQGTGPVIEIIYDVNAQAQGNVALGLSEIQAANTNNSAISIASIDGIFEVKADCDDDGLPDNADNCSFYANGPDLGTCVNWYGTKVGTGIYCTIQGDPACTAAGYFWCDTMQYDTYPPSGNGVGNACECEGNFDGDHDQDGTDSAIFNQNYGRSKYNNPCAKCVGGSRNGLSCGKNADCPGGDCVGVTVNPCKGDFDCDGDVDSTDATKYQEDYGRSSVNNPCPTFSIPAPPWCNY